ncbi:1-deoxy-D-xylulose-5-phosphate synthase [bacterium]|nr:1-deoxy-D-xylulose-5-phosphate synthase [bacterium]
MNKIEALKSIAEIKEMSENELIAFSEQVRTFFIETILQNGGHFSANLGVVELTLALLKSFDFQKDKLVWDVGHQSYIYKLLTDRFDQFSSIRNKGGLSGFPKMEESSYDHFGTGHSSTSISAILGYAESAYISRNKRKHIAVIGDGSLSGGMAFEALNNLGKSKADVLVIVNDNKMGIDPNTGAMTHHLSEIEAADPNIFENLGLFYKGPIDGHDIGALLSSLSELEKREGPKILHIKTIKGKGYEPAEREQTKWHSVKYVKIEPGRKPDEPKPERIQDVFGNKLLELAQRDERVIGITPAMPSGSSMKIMMEAFPNRVFDVGIAEQHAVTFAAGLALDGKRPFCHIYSSFAQRAYDQIIHDVALQKIPVIFCLDRAGLAGEDGPTHHGVFDLAYLNPIPNLVILAPMDAQELEDMMEWAYSYEEGPVVIRYPKGDQVRMPRSSESIELGKPRWIQKGKENIVLSLGTVGNEVSEALQDNELNNWSHVDLRFLKTLDKKVIREIFSDYKRIVTIEDGVLSGGLASVISSYAAEMKYKGEIESLGIPDEFSPHGSIEELKLLYGLDSESISNHLKK